MAFFQLLDQPEEDKLHKTRLLGIEEKPFKRITKRLLTTGSLVSTPAILPPTPPPESNADKASGAEEVLRQKQLDEQRQFRDDVLLDFAAFDSSIARLQFLHKSNEAERDRYRKEKDRILQKAQEVKDSTTELRLQLESARQTMEQRKKFDELAEKITNNRLLRPREDQEGNLRKLQDECRELEKESQTYSLTWTERREQFGRIVEEGLQLRRLIRDEKEEVERREGMDRDEEDGEVGENASRGGATPKHSSQSGGVTPRPESAATPLPDGGPPSRPSSSEGRGSTSHHHSFKEGLMPPHNTLSKSASKAGSRASSRISIKRKIQEPEDGEDTQMLDAEVKPKDANSPITSTVDTPLTGISQLETPAVAVDETSEEGAIDETIVEDQMDTT